MLTVEKITPAIGAQIKGVDFTKPISTEIHDAIYEALIDNLVIFFRDCQISPAAHLEFAQKFGKLDEPHPHYPHVDGYGPIVLLENNEANPPDTNTWHTDLTFKEEQPFASILVARSIPKCGGDTMWSSCYAAYERLPDGMKNYLEGLEAIHDYGDFRNSFVEAPFGAERNQRLNESVSRFGQNVRPIISRHPASDRKFLNFNLAFVAHIVGLMANDSASLKTFLANHMNKPEDQIRWKWKAGDIAMWDNRVTMHYALSDYYPQYRCMNRITVLQDRRAVDCIPDQHKI